MVRRGRCGARSPAPTRAFLHQRAVHDGAARQRRTVSAQHPRADSTVSARRSPAETTVSAERAVAGSRLSTEAWEALFRAQVAVMRRLTQDDIWDDISVREYDVLFQVATAPSGRLRLRDLNEQILLSQPSLSRLVERLESRGLVIRDKAADDGRGVTVRLTQEGAQVQRRVGLAHVQTIHRFVGGALDADELATLRDLCRRILAAQATIPAALAPPTPSQTFQEQS